MWPLLLDMTKDECKRTLRRLELEAYGNIVSALRAQGGLSTEKHKLLQDVASTLNISQERHRAEIRRAVNDERLATISHCMTGDDTTDEWALEGRRLVPLMPRLVPQTAYSVIADDEANKVSIDNEKLPLPANTERKRPLPSTIPESVNKNVHFRVPSESTPKTSIQNNIEEISNKKRKPNLSMESSSLAQHLMMGQPKISRVQQLYRQKTKALLKSQMKHRSSPSVHQMSSSIQKTNLVRQEEDNSLTTITEMAQKPQSTENKVVNSAPLPNPSVSNENQTPKPKPTIIHTTMKPTVQSTNNLVAPQLAPIVTSSVDTPQKSIKICPARKVITTTARTQSQPQKVIIVSTSQGTTTSSILQRTLTIPFVKTIGLKNIDKVKVLNNALHGSSVTTSVTNTNQKPKLLTVQTKVKTGTPTKHVSIPFIQGVQLQALQNKGAIKMVPLSAASKVTSKSAIITSTSGPVYIMNSNTNLPVVTSSNASPIITAKPQNNVSETQETERNVYIIKNEEIQPIVSTVDEPPSENIVYINKQQQLQKSDSKSSVLAEILKASGVLPNDEIENADIETQISQLTEIPNSATEVETVVEQHVVQPLENTDVETVVEESVQEVEHFEETIMQASPDASNYVILQENVEQTQTILMDEQPQHNEEVVELMGSLDPETGLYSVKAPDDFEIIQDDGSQSQIQTDSYVIDMESLQNSDLDMPSLAN